ncbi:MAG: hypothetical protein LAP85_06615 [Acidobacteriia bacterium]|nr:hypothetical protein [Terriglobia bacterium]
MSDAAQGEPIRHEVFTSPFKVEPEYEMWKTPGNYRSYPGGRELPAELKVWRIQNTAKNVGGVVADPDRFDGFPDAEILTPGFNVTKQSGAAGVSRHGNFLQWGFSGAPSQMTAAGRNFFLNCVCYVHKFDGKPPLVKLNAASRNRAITTAFLMKIIRDSTYLQAAFPADLFARYKDDPDGLARHYQDNLELVFYSEKRYLIDDEMRSLGLNSNRRLETLEKLIALLKDPEKAQPAGKLLKRYTGESFQDTAHWEEWLNANRGRIFFTDVGGYKFLVIPAGYLPRELQ